MRMMMQLLASSVKAGSDAASTQGLPQQIKTHVKRLRGYLPAHLLIVSKISPSRSVAAMWQPIATFFPSTEFMTSSGVRREA